MAADIDVGFRVEAFVTLYPLESFKVLKTSGTIGVTILRAHIKAYATCEHMLDGSTQTRVVASYICLKEECHGECSLNVHAK